MLVGRYRAGPGGRRRSRLRSRRWRARSFRSRSKLPLAIVEDPGFKDGENYYSDQSDNFFVGNSFPTCGINFNAQEIMAQTKEDQ